MNDQKLVYTKANQVCEKEVENYLDTIKNMLEMSAFNAEYLRHQIEKANPIFAELLQKFIVLELAKYQSLMVVCKEMEGMLKEFYAVKYNGTAQGEA